jgi:S1-C subfamily serine protease
VTAKTAQRPLESDDEEADDNETQSEPVRNKLGMSVQNITAELRRLYNIPASVTGVIVTDVKNVSPAGEANINEGDVISDVQGQRVTNIDEFRAVTDRLRAGQRVRMYVTTPTRSGAPISTYRILEVP